MRLAARGVPQGTAKTPLGRRAAQRRCVVGAWTPAFAGMTSRGHARPEGLP